MNAEQGSATELKKKGQVSHVCNHADPPFSRSNRGQHTDWNS
jgi:hypothetical protein